MRNAMHDIVVGLLSLNVAASLAQEPLGASSLQQAFEARRESSSGTDEMQDEKVIAGFAKTALELADGGRMNCYLRKGTGPTLVLVPGTWGGIWRFEGLVAELPATIGLAEVGRASCRERV